MNIKFFHQYNKDLQQDEFTAINFDTEKYYAGYALKDVVAEDGYGKLVDWINLAIERLQIGGKVGVDLNDK